MALITWADVDPCAKRQTVYYEGSSTITVGMPVAYNYDTTTNWSGVDRGAAFTTEPAASTTTAEGNQNEGKWIRVEDVTAANALFFAGVVAKGSNGIGAAGPNEIDIYVASTDAIVPIYTDKNITIKDKLYLEAGQITFVNDSVALPYAAIAMETIDRSSTAGLCLAKLEGVEAAVVVENVSARSRATTALPTAAIWDNIDLDAIRLNAFNGSLFESDYTHGESAPMNSYVSATYSAAAEGKALTEYIKVGAEVVGNLDHFATTDNQVVEWQVPCPITVSGGNKWGFEVRLKLSTVTDTKGKMALGLMKPQIMSGDILTDAGAIVDGGFVGLHWKEADGNVLDFVYDETSQAQNEHDDDYIVPIAATYLTFGMYFNGTTIQGYADGVLTGTAISAVDIAAADFPTAEVLVPTLALKGAAADDVTVSIDWIRVAQEA